MRRKGRFKAFLENTAITYRPPTLKAPETPLSRELDALERLVRSGFREGSIFFERQRDTPHPLPLDTFPRSWDNFNICDNIRVVSDCDLIFGTPTHTRERATLPAL